MSPAVPISSVPAQYALLIGVDAYPVKPLRGCVRDVHRIKQYLEGASPSLQFDVLTATFTSEASESSPLGEPAHLWPTTANVTAALEHIITSANPGDLVYVHFSSHGTRIGSAHKFSDQSTGDLALVLLDPRDVSRTRNLHGVVLASYLKRMVDKGLVVTMVLDCCYSASVYRHESQDVRTRYLPPPDLPPPALSQDIQKSSEGAPPTASRSGYRDVSMLPNWLVNPDGYAILAACGPHELAHEIRMADDEIHGVLSHSLLSILQARGLGMRHEEINQLLGVRICELGILLQSPVVYGSKSQSFFRSSSVQTSNPIIPVMNRDGRWILGAGEAHGVRVGDQFALHPIDIKDHEFVTESNMRIDITEVGPLTSLFELPEGLNAPNGWFATGVPRKYLEHHPTVLDSELSQDGNVLGALAERSIQLSCTESLSKPSFHFTLNDDHIGILPRHDDDDSTPTNPNIADTPVIPRDGTHPIFVAKALEHLARYTLIRDLHGPEVPNLSFSASFTVKLINQISGATYFPDSITPIITPANTKYHLLVTNNSLETLYIHIYNLGPGYQVTNILKADHYALSPADKGQGLTGVFKKALRTSVPADMLERGLMECEDVVKVFATSHRTSFGIFEMPKLFQALDYSRNPAASTVRSPTKFRSSDLGVEDGGVAEAWMAFNFVIRTFAGKERE
ncbi:caspase domain-containing protein [Aspergillus multicolor]|uniref:caspase domain-containing protein n=1 Tax=Aspergillus multicolor TaxID=41759 RepID=UPI003CCE5119